MWRGTFLPPNRSISNITGWNLVEPTSGEILRLFWFQKIMKSPKWGPKFQGRVIPGKKKTPARNAPHRSPEWGWSPESKYPDIQISRYPDIQMSRCRDIQISGIRYQISGIRYQKNESKSPKISFSKKSRKSSNRANWSYEPIDPSGDLVFYYCVFLVCFGKKCFWDKIPCRLGRASEPIRQRLICCGGPV